MRIAGTLIALGGLALLYSNSLIIGMIAFILGGFLAKGLFVSLKSLAIVVGVFLLGYGYHNEFTTPIIIALAICFIIVFFSKRRRDSAGAIEWGCDWDLGDLFSANGDGGGGGDCGGGD